MSRVALVAVALLLVAEPAFACAVCGGNGQNRQAFVDTMIFLSLMPLAMLGAFFGGVWYLSRASAESAEETPAPSQGGSDSVPGGAR